MSEVINKHSRMPRTENSIAPMEREQLTPGQLANLIGGKNPLANVDPQKVLARYMADESTLDIAKDHGVTRSGLNKWLRQVAEEDWLEAQRSRAISRKEKAEDALEAATNPMEIARAEKVLKGAQWELEKVLRRIYGQDHNINLNVTVTDLGDRLRRARERVTIEQVKDIAIGSNAHHAPLAHAREDAEEVEIQDAEPVESATKRA